VITGGRWTGRVTWGRAERGGTDSRTVAEGRSAGGGPEALRGGVGRTTGFAALVTGRAGAGGTFFPEPAAAAPEQLRGLSPHGATPLGSEGFIINSPREGAMSARNIGSAMRLFEGKRGVFPSPPDRTG
jgi:hypothetical protein